MPLEHSNSPVVARDQTGDRMQRIRVGLTGLAVVLLLVALATALVARVDGAAGSAAASAAAAKAEDKGEPLAELGVAPASAENQTHTPSKN
jgi:hypothetical protein